MIRSSRASDQEYSRDPINMYCACVKQRSAIMFTFCLRDNYLVLERIQELFRAAVEYVVRKCQAGQCNW